MARVPVETRQCDLRVNVQVVSDRSLSVLMEGCKYGDDPTVNDDGWGGAGGCDVDLGRWSSAVSAISLS